MRWFVVFLLLANLVLYLWVAYVESPRPAQDLPPPDIGRLPLLHEAEATVPAETATPVEPATLAVADEVVSPDAGPSEKDHEVPADTAEASAAVAAGEEAPAAPPGTASPAAQQAVASIDPVVESGGVADAPTAPGRTMPSNDDVDQPSGETVAVGSVIQAAPLEQPAAAYEQVDAATLSTPVQAVPEATVASERAAAVSLPDAVPEAAPQTQPAATSASLAAVNRCLRVGPLTLEQAQALRATIQPDASVVEEQRRETTVIDGYYVLIPPLASRQEGNRKLDELSAAGVTDTWLFRSGDLRNAISLGYFKREASALRHAETISGLGFEVEVREKPVQVERSWLLVSRPSTPGAAVVTELAPAGVSVERIDCPPE